MSKPDSDPTAAENGGATSLEFEDSVVVQGTKDLVWSIISDPETLARCVPGADDVTRVSKRKYTCEITRGISHLTISLSGDIDLVEMNEPDWIVARGTAHDPKTHSDFELLAAMEMETLDDNSLQLAYSASVSFTGGVASLPNRMLRRIFESDIETYFENVRSTVEQRDPDQRSTS